ncbi:MAG: PIN domain-containing protein [bacterium]
MTGSKIFIDSNVLIYLVDKNIAKREKVISIASRDCIISTQVVAENISVCLKKLKLPLEESIEHSNGLLNNFTVSIIQPSILKQSLFILKKYHFSFWDSLIIASALENNCDILYSEDMQNNQVIEGRLKIVNPFI